MTTSIRMMKRFGVAFAMIFTVGVAGCATSAGRAAPVESAAVEESAPPETVPVGAPECLDHNDKPAECLEDSDCCAGFVCGKDPELSRRTTFCIYAG